MKVALKAEFRKLFTVRATYFITGLALALITFGSIYVEGFSKDGAPLDSHKLSAAVLGGIPIFARLAAIVVILLMAYEYRYNTITYTLTSSNSRTKVLFSKIAASVSYTLVFAVVSVFLTIGLTYLGLKLKGAVIPHQQLDLLQLLGRNIYYLLGYSLMGLLLITLLRSLVATIVILFLFPDLIEGLLGLVLKAKAAYLPFSALQQVVTDHGGRISAIRGAVVFSIYLVVGWIIAWQLFLRRDAS